MDKEISIDEIIKKEKVENLNHLFNDDPVTDLSAINDILVETDKMNKSAIYHSHVGKYHAISGTRLHFIGNDKKLIENSIDSLFGIQKTKIYEKIRDIYDLVNIKPLKYNTRYVSFLNSAGFAIGEKEYDKTLESLKNHAYNQIIDTWRNKNEIIETDLTRKMRLQGQLEDNKLRIVDDSCSYSRLMISYSKFDDDKYLAVVVKRLSRMRNAIIEYSTKATPTT